MQVQPYLFFNGRCSEAMEFYQKALGARIDRVLRFNEAPQPPPANQLPPGWGDKVMHASFHIGDTEVMASDAMSQEPAAFNGFSLSLEVANEAEADRLFAALTDGGQVRMPLGKTFFSPRFGMGVDRFGVHWMVTVRPPAAD